MNVWAFDLATVTGVARGEPPENLEDLHSGRLELRMSKGEDVHDLSYNFLAYLRDTIKFSAPPDLIVVEKPISVTATFTDKKTGRQAFRNEESVLLPHLLYDRLHSLSRSQGVPLEALSPATVRKSYLGVANMGDRKETKQAVIQMGITWGYLPGFCKDDNRADAVALWHYAQTAFGKWQPPYTIFGGRRIPLIEREGGTPPR